MENYEKSGSGIVNPNAEWEALKDLAANGGLLSEERDFARDEKEREKCRRRGERILRIVNRMPEKFEGSKDEVLLRVRKSLKKAGLADDYEDALASRKEYEESIDQVGGLTFTEDEDLSAEEEARVEQLRERVVDLSEIEPGALAAEFPSSNYLYHGATVERIEKILKTGALKNGVALQRDDPEISGFDINSGFEGLSWSMDGIDALPGTRRHIAGFLAAPEDVLGDETQLVIPSRPAPYEMLQISDEIDPQELYKLKNQCETFGQKEVSFAEMNNVDSNLMRMYMHRGNPQFFANSMVYDYTGDLSAESLRKHYEIDENGNLTWDEDIFQKFEVPPALPWMQSLIDRGVMTNLGYEQLDDVRKIIDYSKEGSDEFIIELLTEARAEAGPLWEWYQEMLTKAEPVRVPVEKMYFVASHHDLDDWLKVMARTGANPKGILLYDDDKVALENFASQFEGNQEELSEQIGGAVGVNSEFWKDEIGMDPASLPRSGNRGQVLLESTVRHDVRMRMEDGKLKIVE